MLVAGPKSQLSAKGQKQSKLSSWSLQLHHVIYYVILYLYLYRITLIDLYRITGLLLFYPYQALFSHKMFELKLLAADSSSICPNVVVCL